MPVTVDEATFIVRVELPAPLMEVGLKLTVTPAGWPLAVNEIAELNPPVTVLVIVDFPEPPCTTETEFRKVLPKAIPATAASTTASQ